MTLIENKDDWKTIRLDKVLTKKEETTGRMPVPDSTRS